MQSNMQGNAIARLISRHGKAWLDYDRRCGTAYLRTADAMEFAINRHGDVRVNWVHPYRRPANRIRALLTA